MLAFNINILTFTLEILATSSPLLLYPEVGESTSTPILWISKSSRFLFEKKPCRTRRRILFHRDDPVDFPRGKFGWLVYRTAKVLRPRLQKYPRSKGERRSSPFLLLRSDFFSWPKIFEKFRKFLLSAPSDNVWDTSLRRNNPIYPIPFRIHSPSPFAPLRNLWSLTCVPHSISIFYWLWSTKEFQFVSSFVSPFVKYLKPVFALSFLSSRYVSGIFYYWNNRGERMFFRERKKKKEREEEGGREKKEHVLFFTDALCEKLCVLRWLHIRIYIYTWLSFSMNVPSSLVVGPRATSFSRRELESAHCGTTSITWYRGTNCVKWKYMRGLMCARTPRVRVKRNLDARSDRLLYGTWHFFFFFFSQKRASLRVW